MYLTTRCSVLAAALLQLACSAPQSAELDETRSRYHDTRFAGASLESIDSLVHAAIEDRWFPAAAVAIGREDSVAKLAGYGTFTYESAKPVTPDSPFGLASLTKVIATTTAAMLLYESGDLELDAPVSQYLDEYDRPDKRHITIRQLLMHTSGLPAYITFYEEGLRTRQAILDSIFSGELESVPGETYRYSDFGMITLALVVEQITGKDFGSFTQERIFEPLGMHATGFRGTGIPDTAVVPTERDDYFRRRLVQGEVHDENAWILGGTAGHAGLFSTARDLARFATMLVQDGRLGDLQLVRPETLELFTAVVDTSMSTRALGWDTKAPEPPASAGQLFGARSYGHTGFTGTSIWIDPDADLYVIVLTNRVYPTRRNYDYVRIRPAIAEVAYAALVGVPADWEPEPEE